MDTRWLQLRWTLQAILQSAAISKHLKLVDSWEIYDDENIQFQPILLYDLLKELYQRSSLESIIVTWSFTKQYQ